MLPKEISSLQHPIVKTFVKLHTSRKARYEKKQVVLAGTKLVSEAKELDVVLALKEMSLSFEAKETYVVSEAILKKVTGLQNPEPIAALAPMPPFVSLAGKQWILALDGVSDPGNLGTLLRSALALGWEGAFLTETTVDPFNDKALRSAKGATFRLPLQVGRVDEIATLGTPLIADAGGTPLTQLEKRSGQVLVLGNEATGVSPILKDQFQRISIPIDGIESLNVAAAGAILLYTLKNER